MCDPVRPLSRNRDYTILWSSQLLSELAIEVAAVAFPLLILLRTGSPLQLGLASSVGALASTVAVVPAGVLADHWDRRRLMLGAQALRALAMGSLVVVLLTGTWMFAHVLLVLLLEGVLNAVFDPVEHATLPQVVAPSQLREALSRNAARPFIAGLVGPAVAGYAFALGPIHPFALYTGVLAVSTASLLFLRVPRRSPPSAADGTSEDRDDASAVAEPTGAAAAPPAETDPATVAHRWRTVLRSLLDELSTGLRWVAGQPVLRSTLWWIVATNLLFNALVVIIIARSYQQHVGASGIGLMMACLGAGGLLGGVVAAWGATALSSRTSMLAFSWTAAVATAGMSLVPGGPALGALLGVTAVLAPVANTAVLTEQIMMTPDRLRGRLSGIVGLCSGAAGVVGPLVGGVLVSVGGSGAIALLACAAALLVVAVSGSLSPALRRMPRG